MTPRTVNVAAIQMQTIPGDAAANIALAERMATQAFDDGADVVGLPEFFTGAVTLADSVFDLVLPQTNTVQDMFTRLANRFGGRIGGSALVADCGEIYNRYYFAEPGGHIHVHDKDLPTFWECAVYRGGSDDGVWETGLGAVGAAVCWELIRTGTVQRMLGRVGLAVTGTHWYGLPSFLANLPMLRSVTQYNRYLADQAPVEFAKLIGAPVLHANHCGPTVGKMLLAPGTDVALPYRSHCVGAAQIIDADGNVLAARQASDGPGIVAADVTLGSTPPRAVVDDEQFWIPALPLLHKAHWRLQNLACAGAYHRYGRRRGLEAAERAALGATSHVIEAAK